MFKKLKRRIRNVFITGLLITLPIALTYWILQLLFTNLDALSPVFTKVLIDMGAPIPEGYRIPALGLVITLLIVLTVGWFTTNFFGKQMIKIGEGIVEKIPFVRRIYKGSKQVVQSIAHADTSAFRKVVLIEFPRRGMLAIGLLPASLAVKFSNIRPKMFLMFLSLPCQTPHPVSLSSPHLMN